MANSDTPLEAYKAIIDKLVTETRNYGSGSSVERLGCFSRAPDHAPFNAFIESLSEQQTELVSHMLQTERDNTIHDVLAELSWWIEVRDVGLTFRGELMPVDLSGMGLHGDYVGRRDGWQWPAAASITQ